MEYFGMCGIFWNIWNIYEKFIDYIPQHSKNVHASSQFYQLNSKFVGMFGIFWKKKSITILFGYQGKEHLGTRRSMYIVRRCVRFSYEWIFVSQRK